MRYHAEVDVIIQWPGSWGASTAFIRIGGATRAEAKERLGDLIPAICRGDRFKVASYLAWQPVATEPVTQVPEGAEVISIDLSTLKFTKAQA